MNDKVAVPAAGIAPLPNDTPGEFLAAVAAFSANVGKIVDLPGGGIGVLRPTGSGAFVLDEFPAVNPVLPNFIKETVTLDDAASFVAYVDRFKTDDLLLTAAGGPTPAMRAFLDYHLPIDGEPPVVRPNKHIAVWPMRYSPEWIAWNGLDGRGITQAALLDFLDEHGVDVVDPPGIELFDQVGNIKSKSTVTYESAIRLSDGRVQVSFKDEGATNGGKGEVALPGEITVGVPIFFGSKPYKVSILLRSKIEGGKLAFMLVIKNKARLLDDAQQLEIDQVASTLGVPALRTAGRTASGD